MSDVSQDLTFVRRGLGAGEARPRARRESEAPLLMLVSKDHLTVFTVYVVEIEASKPRSAGFSLSPDGPFVTGGLEWNNDPVYSLVLQLQLGTGVRRVRPGTGVTRDQLLVYEPVRATQTMIVANQGQELPFFVEFDDGPPHDPIMVVTPLLALAAPA